MLLTDRMLSAAGPGTGSSRVNRSATLISGHLLRCPLPLWGRWLSAEGAKPGEGSFCSCEETPHPARARLSPPHEPPSPTRGEGNSLHRRAHFVPLRRLVAGLRARRPRLVLGHVVLGP